MAVKVRLDPKAYGLTVPLDEEFKEAKAFAITQNGDLILLVEPKNQAFRCFAKGSWLGAEIVLSEGQKRQLQAVPE